MEILAENPFCEDEFIVVLRHQGEFEKGQALDFGRGIRLQKPGEGLSGQSCAFLASLFPAQIELDLQLLQAVRFGRGLGWNSPRGGEQTQSGSRSRIRWGRGGRAVGKHKVTRPEPAATCAADEQE